MSFDLRAIFVNVFAAARDGRPLTLYALLTCVNEADRKIILNHRIVYKFEIVTPFLIAIRRGHIATALVIRNFFAAEMSQDGTYILIFHIPICIRSVIRMLSHTVQCEYFSKQ